MTGACANAIMGVTFGALHLLAAAYLFITEKPAKAEAKAKAQQAEAGDGDG